MMKISLEEIKDHEIVRHYLLSPHDLPAAASWEETGDFKLNEPVTIDVTLLRSSGMVEVKGHFRTSFASSCGRCLKNFIFAVDEPFALTFTNAPFLVHEEGGEEEEGVELSAEEVGLIFFSGESLDLSDAIIEQLLLALPAHPLCFEECKGLCPHCGIDLNEKKCHCAPLDFSNRFSALKDIKIN